ncbi:hypothetical protein AB0A76_09020 [Streptomyces exfoliatus]|uniref:HK97 gp10 family phage protein n=1 Tax=Streptomyces exfoliatus TaxID=1905 RepID=A0ABV3CT09_STREX
MDSVRIVGTEQLLSLHSRLRSANEARVAALLTRRIRRAAEPLQADLKNTIRTLPIRSEARRPGKRGGPTATTRPLRATIAEAVRISVRTTRPVGARVWVDRWSLPSDLQKMPAVMNSANGRIRHPVFGNKRRWANQWTTPLWWDKTVRQHTPRMTAEVARVLDDVRRQIT